MTRRAMDCGVLVVGTGVAGVAAAIGAARSGARTILIGEEAQPGGVAVAGMHRSMCGLFRSGAPAPDRPINDGVVQEVFDGLVGSDPTSKVTTSGRVYVLPFETRHLVGTLRRLLEGEASLETRFATRVRAASVGRLGIDRVEARDDAGEIEIRFRALVDCSGDAGVLRMAGAPHQATPDGQTQLAGRSLRLAGFDDDDDLLRIKVPYELRQAAAQGRLPHHARFTQLVPGIEPGQVDLKLSVPPAMEDREARSRADAERIFTYLRERLVEFRSARIVDRSPRVADREGKRIIGTYTLTEDDVLSARKFPDGVVKGTWPIELWDQERGPTFRYLPEGEHYDIPIGCLKVAEIPNAWAAGRCISATHMAQASTRAMGTCISLGEQAGIHAARHAM